MRRILTDEELTANSYFVRGYKTLGNRLYLDQALADVYILIRKLDGDVYYGNFCSKTEDIIAHTKDILSKHYHFHKIPHISSMRTRQLTEESKSLAKSKDIEEKFDFLDKVEEVKKLIHPFSVPLKLGNYDSVFNGSMSMEIMGIPHSDFIPDLSIAFTEIYIDSVISDLSVSVYGHELTHTQIESVKKACLDFQNCEVISIFNEKLCALELDPTGKLLKEIEKRRFKAMAKNIKTITYSDEKFEIFKSSYYINSTLKATHLFDKYLYGSEEEKERIINGIQRIFDGEISVEDLLKEHSITYKNSCSTELIKRHI